MAKGGVEPYTVNWLRISYLGTNGSMTFIPNDPADNYIIQEQNGNQMVSLRMGSSQGTSAEEMVVARVTDAHGNMAFSEVFYLTFLTQDLHITSQSDDIIGNVGDNATIFVTAKGGKAPYTYEWQRATDEMGWALPENNTSSTYSFTLDEFDFTHKARYMCKVTDANGDSIYSEVITVTAPTLEVNAQTREIETQPGEYFDMAIILEGGQAPYSYVWEMSTNNGATWNTSYREGATGTTNTSAFGLSSVIGSPQGYVQQWRASLTDASGQHVVSDIITLTYPELTVDNNSINADIPMKVGQQYTMIVTAEGGVPFTYLPDAESEYAYVWQVKRGSGSWEVMEGHYSDRVTVIMDAFGTPAANQYRCIVMDAAGNSEYTLYDWTFSLQP